MPTFQLIVRDKAGVEMCHRELHGDYGVTNQPFAAALRQHPCCEVSLTEGDKILVSVGPTPCPRRTP